MRKIYITGTDTGVGKTYFSALLAKHLIDEGAKVKYIKPVQTGYPEDDDAAYVRQFAGLGADDCKVLHTAKAPVAPYLAFDEFPFYETVSEINSAKECDWLIVEGAGGIMVPLDRQFFNYHLIDECEMETICVVANKLGCVNHSMLTKHFLESSGMNFMGFAVNNYFADSKFDNFNIPMLNDLTDESVRCIFSKVIEYIDVR